ncbi:hypothetical protein CRE_16430 [Caenorhabditis remanei]|uniref:Uncharacterized protein n=1 Tax=Caenorhabditis remanei TaxID=31234 RepID=E3NF80_CAERE|nr:hypothetical protein CRE_16430 [Caenorhabditis remanei]
MTTEGIQELFLVGAIFTFPICLYFHFKFIKIAVIREYFTTFSRALLGLISGGYVITVAGNLTMIVTQLKQSELMRLKLEATNVHFEFIMNFLKLFFFIDAYFGDYKRIFKNHPKFGFLIVFLSIFLGYMSLLIPEFTYRGFDENHPSAYVLFGITSLNLVLNVIVFCSKKRAIITTHGKVDLQTRFMIFEAKETLSVVLFVTTFRFLISLSWIAFHQLPIQFPPQTILNAHLIFGFLRGLESISFPTAFLFYHERIQRHVERKRRGAAKNEEPRSTKGEILAQEWLAEEYYKYLANLFKGPGPVKESKGKRQKAVTISEQRLLESHEILE